MVSEALKAELIRMQLSDALLLRFMHFPSGYDKLPVSRDIAGNRTSPAVVNEYSSSCVLLPPDTLSLQLLRQRLQRGHMNRRQASIPRQSH